MMDLHSLRFSQSIAQLVERDVWVLCDQFLEERLMQCQLSSATRRPLGRGFSMTLGPNLTRPPCPRRK